MVGQQRLQLCQCDVGCRLDRTQDQVRMRLDLTRTPIATLLLRLRRPVLHHALLPADRACRADTEPIRRLSARQATRNCRHYPVPKIR